MNTNTHSVRRRIAAAAVAAIVLPVFAACGADIDPPTQTINRGTPDKTTTVPEHKSGNRLDFDDEYVDEAAEDEDEDDDEDNDADDGRWAARHA